jgi:hypothetical protein
MGHLDSPPVFSRVRVTRSLVLCIFCSSLFVLLSFFFWSLCCLFFFDLRILIGIFKLFMIQIWLNIPVKTLNLCKILMSHYLFFHLSRLTTGFVTLVILGGLLVEQDLCTHSEHFISRHAFVAVFLLLNL